MVISKSRLKQLKCLLFYQKLIEFFILCFLKPFLVYTFRWNEIFKMILTHILQPDCVKVPLSGKDKQAVIAELVELLNTNKLLIDKDDVLQSVMNRESTRSTGIGSGIAIPHGKCKGVKELVMAIGVSRQGIDFQSIDDKPVYIVVLLASPTDKTGPHIQALARISRLMLDESFRNKLRNAPSAKDLYDLISSKEAE